VRYNNLPADLALAFYPTPTIVKKRKTLASIDSNAIQFPNMLENERNYGKLNSLERKFMEYEKKGNMTMVVAAGD